MIPSIPNHSAFLTSCHSPDDSSVGFIMKQHLCLSPLPFLTPAQRGQTPVTSEHTTLRSPKRRRPSLPSHHGGGAGTAPPVREGAWLGRGRGHPASRLPPAQAPLGGSGGARKAAAMAEKFDSLEEHLEKFVENIRQLGIIVSDFQPSSQTGLNQKL